YQHERSSADSGHVQQSRIVLQRKTAGGHALAVAQGNGNTVAGDVVGDVDCGWSYQHPGSVGHQQLIGCRGQAVLEGNLNIRSGASVTDDNRDGVGDTVGGTDLWQIVEGRLDVALENRGVGAEGYRGGSRGRIGVGIRVGQVK